MKFQQGLKLVVAALALIVSAPAAGAQERAAVESDELIVIAPNPPMWRLHDEDSEVLILATVAALPRRTGWNRTPFQRALAGADAFLIEDRLSIDPLLILQLFTTRRTAFINPNGARLSEFLEPAVWAQLQQSARAVDQNPNNWERLRPYAAGASLINERLKQVGLDTRIDIAREARDLARRARVRIVEAPVAPIRVRPLIDSLSSMPVGADAPCLEDQLMLSDTAPAIMLQRAEAWVAGDADSLLAFADVLDTSRCVTALAVGGLSFEELTRRRADGWTQYLIGELERPGRRVAVIEGDLFLSRDGVLARLTRAGYEVTPTQ